RDAAGASRHAGRPRVWAGTAPAPPRPAPPPALPPRALSRGRAASPLAAAACRPRSHWLPPSAVGRPLGGRSAAAGGERGAPGPGLGLRDWGAAPGPAGDRASVSVCVAFRGRARWSRCPARRPWPRSCGTPWCSTTASRTASGGSPRKRYKAQGVVEDVTNRIVDHIRPGPYRLHWDSLMTTMDIMETFEENCCVMRYTTAGQLWNIIAPREFVDFSYTTNYEDGLLTCGISLDYGEVRPDFVRGFNHPCGWFCVPLKDYPNHSLLTGYIQTELRGMLPQSAVDTAMASTLANFYSDLKKALKT
uniref:StAR related lipid transfer domain containing 4 n=2 Tax=Anatinae TaxID=2068716 RepID=A0A8C3BSE0_CAIMO